MQTVIYCANVTPAQAAINSEIIAKIREQGGYEYEQHSDFALVNTADIYDELTFVSNTTTFQYRKEEHFAPEIIDATSGIDRFFEWLEKLFTKNRPPPIIHGYMASHPKTEYSEKAMAVLKKFADSKTK